MYYLKITQEEWKAFKDRIEVSQDVEFGIAKSIEKNAIISNLKRDIRGIERHLNDLSDKYNKLEDTIDYYESRITDLVYETSGMADTIRIQNEELLELENRNMRLQREIKGLREDMLQGRG